MRKERVTPQTAKLLDQMKGLPPISRETSRAWFDEAYKEYLQKTIEMEGGVEDPNRVTPLIRRNI